MTVIKRRYNGTWRILSAAGAGGEAPTVPMPPTGVQVTINQAGQASVSWTPPVDNGGSLLTGYVVTFVRVSNGTSDTANTGVVSSTVISDLEAGELYGFTVQAVNALGSSSASQPSVQAMVPTGDTFVMPTLATVGPRIAMTRTMTGSEALDELRDTGYLSGVRISNMFTLAGSDGIDWLIEDCIIEAGSLYGIRGYITTGGGFTGTQAQRPVFRHVDIVGYPGHDPGSGSSTASCISARDIILENVNIYGGQDGLKARSGVEMYNSWIHDLDHPSGAHADAVQIQSGTNIVLIGNRFDAYEGYVSDGSSAASGSTSNAVLQTGTVNNNISALWENNWFAGGHYTIRGAGSDVRVEFVFRNNRFMRFGTSVVLGRTDLEPHHYGATTGGLAANEVWENNVWDDTEELVT